MTAVDLRPAVVAGNATWSERARDLGPIVVLGLLVAYFTWRSPVFFTVTNGRSLLIEATPLAVTAAAMTIVILLGEIDLSVGSVAALVSIIFAILVRDGMNFWLAALLALLAGAGIGVVNGAVTVLGRIPSFITTLGVFSIAQGLGFILADQRTVPVRDLDFFRAFADARPLGIPISAVWAAGAILVTGVLLSATIFGRSVYAVGGNSEASRLSGRSPTRTKLQAFALAGILIGLAGILLAARLGSGKPDAAPNLTLEAIAAVVIGGTSLLGGRGALWRTVVGVFLIALLNNGFGLLNVDADVQLTVKGAIIVVAVALDRFATRTTT